MHFLLLVGVFSSWMGSVMAAEGLAPGLEKLRDKRGLPALAAAKGVEVTESAAVGVQRWVVRSEGL